MLYKRLSWISSLSSSRFIYNIMLQYNSHNLPLFALGFAWLFFCQIWLFVGTRFLGFNANFVDDARMGKPCIVGNLLTLFLMVANLHLHAMWRITCMKKLTCMKLCFSQVHVIIVMGSKSNNDIKWGNIRDCFLEKTKITSSNKHLLTKKYFFNLYSLGYRNNPKIPDAPCTRSTPNFSSLIPTLEQNLSLGACIKNHFQFKICISTIVAILRVHSTLQGLHMVN